MKKNEEMKQEKPKICRIASLKNFGGVIVGRDLGNILEAGSLYQITEILDVIMINKIGNHAEGEHKSIGASFHQILMEGVCMLTEKEYAEQLSLKK